MKILHTADWHIGKVLYKHTLQNEISHFFDWLLQIINSEDIDVLLVSGDIFDLANPASKDREIYYHFLSQLVKTKTHVIITGGNHDGISVIDAPKELLSTLNITVIGGAKENLREEIIEIKDDNYNIQVVIAAVPFLRDRDLRNLENDKQYPNRIEAIREGIKNHYKKLGDLCKQHYQDIPAIAMGHLYAKGALTSESEREIHIGNAAAIESNIFPKEFGYVALGHIHRPQVIAKNEYIRYSGSPISLSFSEREDKKGVIIIELENGEFNAPQFIEIPKQRELIKFSGNYNSILTKLKGYNPQMPLPSFVELNFEEETFSSTVLANIDNLVADYSDHKSFKILKSKTHFKSGAKDTADLFQLGENIEDLSTSEVFAKRIEIEKLDHEQKTNLINAFKELLEIVESEEA